MSEGGMQSIDEPSVIAAAVYGPKKSEQGSQEQNLAAEEETNEAMQQEQASPEQQGVVHEPPPPPIYAFLLGLFDSQVRAAVTMQRAFRKFKRLCPSPRPSELNPFHWHHFTEIRKRTGWSKEELYDEFGKRRQRTDILAIYGEGRRGKNRVLDPIGHFKVPGLANTSPAEHFAFAIRHLADRWHKCRQDALKKSLAQQPFREFFIPGTPQHQALMNWVITAKGHQEAKEEANQQRAIHFAAMQSAAITELTASLRLPDNAQKEKFLSLLSQFKDVLKVKQGATEEMTQKPARLALGVYDWVVKDAGDEFKRTLENSQRYASTPPEPPEGLEQNIYRFYEEVCEAIAASSHRICKLRKPGRRWLAAFENSTQKRRRLIRTRSSGSLGLLGPPCVDASKATTILPLTGQPPSTTELPERYKVFYKLQTIVAAQVKRSNKGRQARLLRCLNTQWMGGVDWESIEAKASGLPTPAGPRAPPPPTEEDLNNLVEDLMQPESEAMKEGELPKDEEEGKPGTQSSQRQQQKHQPQQKQRQLQKQTSRGKRQSVGLQGAHRYMPLPKDRYAEEVGDVLQEAGLADLTCEETLQALMRAARAPKIVPDLDAHAMSQHVDKQLAPAGEHAAEVLQGQWRASCKGHDVALQQATLQHGVRVLRRSFSVLEPNELGSRINLALEQPHFLSLSPIPSIPRDSEDSSSSLFSLPELTWPSLLRAWRKGGLPGWRAHDGQCLLPLLRPRARNPTSLSRFSIFRPQVRQQQQQQEQQHQHEQQEQPQQQQQQRWQQQQYYHHPDPQHPHPQQHATPSQHTQQGPALFSPHPSNCIKPQHSTQPSRRATTGGDYPPVSEDLHHLSTSGRMGPGSHTNSPGGQSSSSHVGGRLSSSLHGGGGSSNRLRGAGQGGVVGVSASSLPVQRGGRRASDGVGVISMGQRVCRGKRGSEVGSMGVGQQGVGVAGMAGMEGDASKSGKEDGLGFRRGRGGEGAESRGVEGGGVPASGVEGGSAVMRPKTGSAASRVGRDDFTAAELAFLRGSYPISVRHRFEEANAPDSGTTAQQQPHSPRSSSQEQPQGHPAAPAQAQAPERPHSSTAATLTLPQDAAHNPSCNASQPAPAQLQADAHPFGNTAHPAPAQPQADVYPPLEGQPSEGLEKLHGSGGAHADRLSGGAGTADGAGAHVQECVQDGSNQQGGVDSQDEHGDWPEGAACDMLLLLQRGSVFWAQVVSDAYALQLMALGWNGRCLHGFGASKDSLEQTSQKSSKLESNAKQGTLAAKASRRSLRQPQGGSRWHTQEEERLMLLHYVEHYMEMQQRARENLIQVSHVHVQEVTPSSYRMQQLQYCKLVKGEMYKLLNRYLVMGYTPPEMVSALQLEPSKDHPPQSNPPAPPKPTANNPSFYARNPFTRDAIHRVQQAGLPNTWSHSQHQHQHHSGVKPMSHSMGGSGKLLSTSSQGFHRRSSSGCVGSHHPTTSSKPVGALTGSAHNKREDGCSSPTTHGMARGNIPQGNIPQGNIPQGNIPQGNIPQGNIPQGNIPQGNIPRGMSQSGRLSAHAEQQGAPCTSFDEASPTLMRARRQSNPLGSYQSSSSNQGLGSSNTPTHTRQSPTSTKNRRSSSGGSGDEARQGLASLKRLSGSSPALQLSSGTHPGKSSQAARFYSTTTPAMLLQQLPAGSSDGAHRSRSSNRLPRHTDGGILSSSWQSGVTSGIKSTPMAQRNSRLSQSGPLGNILQQLKQQQQQQPQPYPTQHLLYEQHPHQQQQAYYLRPPVQLKPSRSATFGQLLHSKPLPSLSTQPLTLTASGTGGAPPMSSFAQSNSYPASPTWPSVPPTLTSSTHTLPDKSARLRSFSEMTDLPNSGGGSAGCAQNRGGQA